MPQRTLPDHFLLPQVKWSSQVVKSSGQVSSFHIYLCLELFGLSGIVSLIFCESINGLT